MACGLHRNKSRMSRIMLFFVVFSISYCVAISEKHFDPIISAAQLSQLIKEHELVVLEAIPEPQVDPKTFTDYGKFAKSMAKQKLNDYYKQHIPGAIPFNLGIAMYPTNITRALYPPNVFQEYARLLGINNNDHIVIYGRDKFAGMLDAAKVWWLLKYYGLNDVQVLDGGFKSWKKAGYPVNSGKFTAKGGNFVSKVRPNLLITFEQLEVKDSSGKSLLDHLNTINFFDARPRDQFTGKAPLKLRSSAPLTGYHIVGSKNLPAVEVINQAGIQSVEHIKKLLKNANYMPGQQIIVACLIGKQGALTMLALAHVGINNVQLYHGSLTEMALRDPARISGK